MSSRYPSFLHRAALAALLAPTVGWLDGGTMKSERDNFSAAVLGDGRVLVAGGNAIGQMQQASTEIYDPAQSKWLAAASMNRRRQRNAAVLLAASPERSEVLVLSGTNGIELLDSAEIYDSAEDRFRLLDAKMHVPRLGASAVRFADGRVLVTGGLSAGGEAGIAAAEIFDPRTEVWTRAPDMAHPRYAHTMTLLGDGTVLVAGGRADATTDLADAEVFDPEGGVWTAVGSLRGARREHTATLLADGRVLVTGGARGGPDASTYRAYAASEVYDPVARAWTPAAAMGHPREIHGAVLLADGKVLVAGGQSHRGMRASAEVYDPVTDAWTFTDPLTFARYSFALVALPNGSVLAAGGYDYRGSVYPTMSELYDPRCAGVCGEEGPCDHSANASKECAPRRCDEARNMSVGAATCSSDSMECTPLAARATVDCSPYRCDDEDGACRSECRSVDDCHRGYACDLSGRCVAPLEPAQSTGRGCSVARRHADDATALAMSLFVAAAAARRRTRRR